LDALDASARNLFPLSLLTGGAFAAYAIISMQANVIVSISLAALISSSFCMLGCSEVIHHQYPSNLLPAWLLLMAAVALGYAIAIAEVTNAFALAVPDATLAAVVGAVLSCVVVGAHFKARCVISLLLDGCCAGRREQPPLAAPRGEGQAPV
jgi:hypothetical protein